MTPSSAGPGNSASDKATVGVQAQWIDGDVTVYQVPENATPEEKFRIGVNYLDGGMPNRAHELIYEAIMNNFQTSEVWFYCLLALLSGRTIRQLTAKDRQQLKSIRPKVMLGESDGWTAGSELIFRLVDSAGPPHSMAPVTAAEIDWLGAVQRDLVVRHLDLFLTGTLKDQMWDAEMERSRRERKGNDREGRVWKFFQPKPAQPRAASPVPTSIPAWVWALIVAAAGTALAGVGYIGSVLLSQAGFLDLLAFLLPTGAGVSVCAVQGLDWRARVDRLMVIEQRWSPVAGPRRSPAKGFASKVSEAFDRYSARYVPEGVNRWMWLAETAGLRRYLRDEIVEIYREQRIPAERVAWLVRHEVAKVKRDWEAGGLAAQTRDLLVEPGTKVACAGGAVALLSGFIGGICCATPADPLGVLSAAFVVVLLALIAGGLWLRLMLDRKRYQAELKESRDRLAERWASFHRWTEKLADKPTDSEMATWLDWDRKALMDLAMRHFRLAPREIIADAFIEAPATKYEQRARVRNGPWRYTKYQLLAFLLTADGVRQVTMELDFKKVTFHDSKWTSYRFDAVVSVEVHERDSHQRMFELVLMNGEPIQVQVTERREKPLDDREDADRLSAADLDAAGLANAIQILEGIAAEGKEWIQRAASGADHAHSGRFGGTASGSHQSTADGTSRTADDPDHAQETATVGDPGLMLARPAGS